jgi:hypothetical protein
VATNKVIDAQLEIPGTDVFKKPDAMVIANPLQLLDKAMDKGFDADTLGKFMALYERWDADQQRKAFVEAMNAFKANPPTILKNKHVKAGSKDDSPQYDHATLDHVVQATGESLSKHGISHRWKTSQAEGRIRVTCILTHEAGHSEETMLESAPDATGGKNSIQAIGSAVTYLQRYTLLAATGLAAKNQDDDGAGTSTLPDAKNRIEEILKASADELNSTFTKHYQTAKKEGAKKSMLDLIEARDVRRGELRGDQK